MQIRPKNSAVHPAHEAGEDAIPCRVGLEYIFPAVVELAGTALNVCRGNPCHGEYARLALDFSTSAAERAATLAGYPSLYTQPAVPATAVEETLS